MAKIIIVGHPDSNHQAVETLLHQHGMNQAFPSKRDGLAPAEINRLLLQSAKSTRPSENIPFSAKKITQRQISGVWNTLAMDLLLSNMEQALWGWSDPEALELLEYWRDVDTSIHFVLVYDTPHSILVRNPQQTISSQTLEKKLQEWSAYNESLLDFYAGNKNRCLLIHSEQAQRTTKKYLKQISRHIEAPWQIKKNKSAKLLAQPTESHGTIINNTSHHNLQTGLAAFLADLLIDGNSEAMNLYETLQQNATLPLKPAPDSANSTREKTLWAWQAMLHQQQEQLQLISNNLTGKNNIETLSEQLQQTEKQLEAVRASHGQVEQKLKDTETLASEYKQKTEAALQTQAQLEKEKSSLQEKQTQLERETSNLKEKVDSFTAKADAAQKDIARLQNTQSTLEEENALLLEQLHLVQEKLEETHLEKQRLAARPVYYGAAERVKNELPYQLGATMIYCSKSIGGCFKMPFALIKTTKLTAKRQKEQAQELPPVHFYNDAADINRVHKHLSYQLGQSFLVCARNPLKWILTPFVLANTTIKFKKQKKAAL
ncbi:hypothetical protein LVJ85_01700 [Neisseria sp. Dent CA1/247]|uniref:hypothetical protein n=1 Tax=Neisseria sp. Dent CA1/247 TaxID=2912675 RepID=UPI001FD5DE05|nr:hypothetical protein [Neisseria sp. Dent CA1/247]UOO77240.1 hypothetical protein LVJ85_01700 [Neisseria sp. Dent CA1/247]